MTVIKNKSKPRKVFFLALTFIVFVLNVFSNPNDTTLQQKSKRNIIYVKPYASFIGAGSFFWGGGQLEPLLSIELGYSRELKTKYTKPRQIDCRATVFIPSVTGSNDTKGFFTNAEYRVVFKQTSYYATNYLFYYSGNIYYQYTQTTVNAEFDAINYKKVSENRYEVFRHEIGLLPKIGIQFINKITGIYSDMGIAIGGRFVTSYNRNKINQDINSGYEPFVNKEFDKGSAFAPKFSFLLLQLKLGYNF